MLQNQTGILLDRIKSGQVTERKCFYSGTRVQKHNVLRQQLRTVLSVSSVQLVLLVHDGLSQALLGVFKIRIELQGLLEVTLCPVEKTCKATVI